MYNRFTWKMSVDNIVVWKYRRTGSLVSIGYIVLILALILILSDVSSRHTCIEGLPFSSYLNLRRRFLSVESSLSRNLNETIQEFPIVAFTWDSSKFPKEGIRGNIIISDPPNACESVEPPPNGNFDYAEDNNGTKWFLLANNDNCDISTKRRNADASGFFALIISSKTANDTGIVNSTKAIAVTDSSSATIGIAEDEMVDNKCNNNSSSSDDNNDIKSDCVSQSEVDDVNLVETKTEGETQIDTDSESRNVPDIYTLELDEGNWILLRENYSYPNPYIVRIEDQLSIFVIAIAIALLVLILIVIITVCVISIKRITKCVQKCTLKRRIARRNNLLLSTVSKLPIRRWIRRLDTLSEENKICTICMEHFKDDEEIRVLSCCHIFHLICVDRWILEGRPFCKICKHNLLSPHERMSPSDHSEQSGNTLQPVYASCESTRLLIPNQGCARNSSTNANPPVLRVTAIMPEVFDASFEAMLPLRTNFEVEGNLNNLVATEVNDFQAMGQRQDQTYKDSSSSANDEESPNSQVPRVKGKFKSQSSISQNCTPSPPSHSPRASPRVPNKSNIYISENEHFV